VIRGDAVDSYLERLLRKEEEKTTIDQKLRELLEEIYGKDVWSWTKDGVIRAVERLVEEVKENE
jgi:hypothetical protein